MRPTLRRLPGPICALLCAALALALPLWLRRCAVPPLPQPEERELLRIWVTSSVGGGERWLKEQLKAWEKRQPGVFTYLRAVSPEEALRPDAVLPDLILYTPGDFPAPEAIFSPLVLELPAREALLRCGRWQGKQYGLPLCWGAWVLAVDGALEPGSAAPPSPTPLLGLPALTPAPLQTAPPGFPLEAAEKQPVALQASGGAGLFSLRLLLEETPRLPDDFAQPDAAAVYAGFRARRYASAMLTTGQIAALTSLSAAGQGFAFRVMTPEEIVTDQVWLGSLVNGASPRAASLLAWLTAPAAQKALASQSLHTVRSDLRLYAAGTEAEVEIAAARSLSAVNAYLPRQAVSSAAWQVFTRRLSLSEALLPLL